jgi:hypothetical protein
MTTSAITGKATVTLGYEPQFVITKAISTTSNWITNDSMRGMPAIDLPTSQLYPNLINAEASGTSGVTINSTGFSFNSGIGGTAHTYIYIAIRRGPMKVPTDATKVFALDTQGSTTPRPPSYKGAFPIDWGFNRSKTGVSDWFAGTRLASGTYLSTNNTNAEAAVSAYTFDYQNGWVNSASVDSGRQSWMFGRAPSFFDVVCYTGTGGATTITHNLAAVPQLILVKQRTAIPTGTSWAVYSAALGNTGIMSLNTNSSNLGSATQWNNTTPTASVFSVGTTGGGINLDVNRSTSTYVAYLFASCPGVSKVGSYTGNGITQAIDCGFTGGARFVLIKRTNATGNWYVYDTARGMTVLTDPYLLLNSTAAETATLGSVITSTGGFTVNASILAAINASGGSYIFLAIA